MYTVYVYTMQKYVLVFSSYVHMYVVCSRYVHIYGDDVMITHDHVIFLADCRFHATSRPQVPELHLLRSRPSQYRPDSSARET